MSTDAEVKEHNEKVLNNLKRVELVAKFAESIGCTDAQAATISKAYADRFVYDGATLSFGGKPVSEAADDVKAHFKTQGLDFLLPAQTPGGKPDVNPALLEKARGEKIKLSDGRKVGDITAYGQLVRQHGKAAIDALLTEKPDTGGESKDDDPALKGGSNPWSPEWCGRDGRYTARALTEQSRLAKTLPLAVVARIAGKYAHIGATRPNKAA
jgi:hypothetical protein